MGYHRKLANCLVKTTCMHACEVTVVVSNSVRPYGLQPTMGFSRQEYWSGLPWRAPGDLPNPGIQPASLMSPALASGFFTTSNTWEIHRKLSNCLVKTMTCCKKYQTMTTNNTKRVEGR